MKHILRIIGIIFVTDIIYLTALTVHNKVSEVWFPNINTDVAQVLVETTLLILLCYSAWLFWRTKQITQGNIKNDVDSKGPHA